MNPLPLDPFLSTLREDGLTISIREYERVQTALTATGPWTLVRFRDVLCALVAKDPEQQDLFLRRFRAFFCLADLEPGWENEPVPPESVAALRRDIDQCLDDIRDKRPDRTIDGGRSRPWDRGGSRPDRRPKARLYALLVLLALACALLFHTLYQPSVRLAQDEIAFGRVAIDDSATREVELSNIGLAPLHVEKVVLTGSDAATFTLGEESAGKTIAARKTWNLSVAFSPSGREGPYRSKLTFHTDDAGGTHSVSLRAEGIPSSDPTVRLEGTYSEETERVIKRIDFTTPVTEDQIPAVFWFLAALALISLLGTVGYAIHLRRITRIPEDEPAEWDSKGEHFFSLSEIGGTPSPFLDPETLNEAADRVGHFTTDRPGRDLDAERTVRETIDRGGVPVFRFLKQRRLRTLILLSDGRARAGKWNTTAEELEQGMARLGIPTIAGRFTDSPERFTTGEGATVHLEDLEDGRAGSLLLIFSDGNWVHRESARDPLERLATWPKVAWMELRELRFWDESVEVVSKHGIPVYPATATGLGRAMADLLTERAGTSGPSAPSPLPGRAGMRLDAYLEMVLGDALPWAQDCAVLQPMPTGLADALRREFHRRLPPERIGRLRMAAETEGGRRGFLVFPRKTRAVLKEGFDRRSAAGRNAVLTFIGARLDAVEPKEKKSPRHAAWEYRRELLRLETEPGYDGRRLAMLSKTPVGDRICAELDDFRYADDVGETDETGAPVKVPLGIDRAHADPGLRHRLSRISDSKSFIDSDLPDRLPLKPIQKALLATLVSAFLIMGTSAALSYRPAPVTMRNLRITGLGSAVGHLDAKKLGQWRTYRTGGESELVSEPLPWDREYRFRLDGAPPESGRVFELKRGRLAHITIRENTRRIWTEPVTGMTFVKIPAGSFQMGSPKDEKGRDDDEGPVHEVVYEEAFWMARHEVTVGQWKTFVQETGYRTEAETGGGAYTWDGTDWKQKEGVYWGNPGFDQTDRHPVTCISWNDAQAFIEWLNGQLEEKIRLRLPSEADWEYACRGGTTTARFWGDDPDEACKFANAHDQTADKKWPGFQKHECEDGYTFTSATGSFLANPYGLYDILGNVWEWCQDTYDQNAYEKHDRKDPIYEESGGTLRVDRGGGWSSSPASVRCANLEHARRPVHEPGLPPGEE